jgi:hypothetical protein
MDAAVSVAIRRRRIDGVCRRQAGRDAVLQQRKGLEGFSHGAERRGRSEAAMADTRSPGKPGPARRAGCAQIPP